MKQCYSCKKELSLDSAIGRRDICPVCGADLRCCLQCKHYDRAASKQCREVIAEMVKEKAKANFCDYFLFAERRDSGAPAVTGEQTRKALEDLFKT